MDELRYRAEGSGTGRCRTNLPPVGDGTGVEVGGVDRVPAGAESPGVNKAKLKKCRHCGKKFQPWNSLQVVCSQYCGSKYGQTTDAQKHRDKAIRQETLEWRRENKSRGQLLREAQRAFNEYIRERDYGLPCISCGREARNEHLHSNQWDASHYRSVGAAPHLRFTETNCHKSCKHCNQWLSGNIVDYRINLCARIGENMVLWLEGPHPEQHWSRDDLREIAKHYRRRTRELKRMRDA